MTTQYWLVKSEPDSYSWADFVRDKKTAWTGVRNFAARLHLKAMRRGDRVLFYESMTTKAIVGTAEVTRAAFPDGTADEPGWLFANQRFGIARQLRDGIRALLIDIHLGAPDPGSGR